MFFIFKSKLKLNGSTSSSPFVTQKKWQEYILEFLMLFVAVSLGFFAENVREQHIEKHREISYLRNVHDDLVLDLKNIETVVYIGFLFGVRV
jgi:hypothetical protein